MSEDDHRLIISTLHESVTKHGYYMMGLAGGAIALSFHLTRDDTFTAPHYLWLAAISSWAISILFGLSAREKFHEMLIANNDMIGATVKYKREQPADQAGYHRIKGQFIDKYWKVERKFSTFQKIQKWLFIFGCFLFTTFFITAMPNNPVFQL